MPLVNPTPQEQLIVLLAIAGGTLILSAVCAILVCRHWLRAFLARAPVRVMSLVGMVLRRSDIKAILNARIMAAQHGLDAPVSQLESAHLGGANLETLVLAAAELKDRGEPIDWQQLIKAHRAGRLAELLGM